MTSLKPYLIRSIYAWIIDNNLTPYLLVDATHPRASLPKDYIEDNKIVLNICPDAIQGLSLKNTTIEFNARFNGQSIHIVSPVVAILAIYAKENGKGMVFDQDAEEEYMPPKTRPYLQVVK